MRRVKFKIRGNAACAATEEEGFFFGFFPDCVEQRDGNLNYTVALVERADGSVKKLDPEDIVFLTTYKPEADGSSKT